MSRPESGATGSAYEPADGPQLVRGVDFVVAADGDVSACERPVVALCRCGATGRPPWCDATHKVLAARQAR